MSRAGWSLVASAPSPGAIGVIQIGGDVIAALRGLTGRSRWPLGRLRLVRFGAIDDGLAARTANDRAVIMPHGGLRVIQRLTSRLAELGLERRAAIEVAATDVYPEARDECEAIMLATLARAASPLAIDLLLDQPRRWRDPSATEVDAPCSKRLGYLVDPPDVVLVGPPNVGKSTLSNALLGRRMSIALDRPGTTRDYTAGLIDLDSLVVRWHDTPGLRPASDSVEAQAFALTEGLIVRAALVIAMTDPDHDWPKLIRKPDLRVSNKLDRCGRLDADLSISALSGLGMSELVAAVRDRLLPRQGLPEDARWRFSELLGPAEAPEGT